MERMPTVYVVDDDVSILKFLAALLEQNGLAAKTFMCGRDFVDFISGHSRGCLLLDAQMPEMNGTELRNIIARSGDHIPIIFISATLDLSMAVSLIKSGVYDVIEKPLEARRVLSAVRAALELEAIEHLERNRLMAIRRQIANLTPRESQVVRLVAHGMANKRIAIELGISERTVESHRSRVMEKLGVESVQALVRNYDAVSAVDVGIAAA